MKRLAIISTYDELCGIAGYTKALVRQLQSEYEVSVFDLDQYILRSRFKSLRDQGDRLVSDISDQSSQFDYVNIQLEHGTLGSTHSDIVRRFKILTRHKTPLTVTFHTVYPLGFSGIGDFAKYVVMLNFREAFSALKEARITWTLNNPIIQCLIDRQVKSQTTAIFHTHRDARNHKMIYGLSRVLDHPLAFYSESGDTAPPDSDVTLPPIEIRCGEPVLLGLFGFISPYKGIMTAVKALQTLPENYHLLIFGALHPNEIRRGYSIHPHLENILELVAGRQRAEFASKSTALETDQINLHTDNLDVIRRAMISVRDVSHRVHFMGAVRDGEFAAAMKRCNIVVLPYEEVGQSSSGPLSIANEVGATIVCSRNKAFLQYERYHPGRLLFFDIGNYLELAERIQGAQYVTPKAHPKRFSVTSNRAVYKASFELPDTDIDQFMQQIAEQNV